MAIKKQSTGKYLLDFRPNGLSGRRVRKLFDTKSQALAYQKKLLASSDSLVKDTRKFSELVQLWVDVHGHHLKSVDDTKARLLNFAVAVGDPLAVDVDAALFSKYRQQRIEAGINPATLNRELITLKALFRELSRLGLWVHDISILSVRKFKEQKNELSYLTTEQIERLLVSVRASSNPSLYPVVLVCLATGARWSESEKLTVKALDSFNFGFNFIDTKNSSNRFVPVSASIFSIVYDYLLHHGSFTSCYAAFRAALKRSAISTPAGQSAHILRHTFASHFIMSGGSLLTLQKILGHTSLNITMRYAHLSPNYLNDAVKFNPLNGVAF